MRILLGSMDIAPAGFGEVRDQSLRGIMICAVKCVYLIYIMLLKPTKNQLKKLSRCQPTLLTQSPFRMI